jgi:hypothetical protein
VKLATPTVDRLGQVNRSFPLTTLAHHEQSIRRLG